MAVARWRLGRDYKIWSGNATAMVPFLAHSLNLSKRTILRVASQADISHLHITSALALFSSCSEAERPRP